MIDPKIPEWQTQNLIDKTTDSGEAHLQESDLTINGKPKVIIAGEGGVNKILIVARAAMWTRV